MRVFMVVCSLVLFVSGCGKEEPEANPLWETQLSVGLKRLVNETSEDSPMVQRIAKNNEGTEDWKKLAEYFLLEKEAVSPDFTWAEAIGLGQISEAFELNYEIYESSMYSASSTTDEETLALLGIAISMCDSIESATKDMILDRLFVHLKVDHAVEVHRAILEAVRMNDFGGDPRVYSRFLTPDSKLKFEVLSILYNMEDLPEVCCEAVSRLRDDSEQLVSDMAKLIAYKKCSENGGEEESNQ